MDAADLSDDTLNSFAIVERVGSVLSLLGCLVVIGTFSASKSFHKPINRLVFYASFGNMMTNVATLMARSYLSDVLSPGCQFQAFLIQMFMPADAFWTLAMAVNVYLTFYYKFDAQKLRRMEIPYLICCYGIPFIVALTFVFVTNDRQGRMYGNATLWCWISSEWDIWRIAMFYGPVWVVILITIFIYIRAGREIYKKHKQLRNFHYSSHHEPEPLPPMDDLYSSSKTTEVYVTTEIVNTQHDPVIDLAPLGRRSSGAANMNKAATPAPPQPSAPANNGRPPVGNAAYSVTISSNKRPVSVANVNNSESYGEGDIGLPVQDESGDRSGVPRAIPMEPNTYTLKQMMSADRTTTSASAVGPTVVGVSAGPRNPPNQRLRRRAAYEANTAAWSYTKCAILFFTAMLVTWIPSSANRVFSVVHVNKVSVPLEYMSSFVLPLQGFWNAIIYLVTSWKAVQTLWSDTLDFTLPWQSRSKRREQQARHNRQSQHAGSYQRQSSLGGPSSDSNGQGDNGRSRPILMNTTKGLPGKNGAFHHHIDSPAGSSSNNSDEMLDQMVGGRHAGSKAEKNYETESVTELAIHRP
ncbi:hypothetical protein SPBR_06954 [Sporothrix brasiliensis 5110]|uniref:G-protein coupled receptors family 2 profile 2 domain-containing protein n=1 Tax=Sporothrix brasiliensis 5110 TaxID=1398154 RepID=A0A0C2INZ6_9PEZI|nr:uncharacterized protein SPBR_06954 [Sporothrix brasiliensis 5110]KIH88630.1 hypothetical protein SPBR_06954 [Sporothrix brasiliensis 5110]